MFGLTANDLSTFLTAIPFSYMALFPVLNPLGCTFVILTWTRGAPEEVYRQVCRKVAINTFVLILVVFFIGTYVLRFFGITLPIVQVGGGIVVSYIGWRLLNQTSDTTSGDVTNNVPNYKKILDMAFYPLTMPLTAGPGCMAVTLTISAHQINRHSIHETILEQAGAIVGILLASITVYICYRYADKITKRLGTSGTQVILRLSAFIIFCIGLQIFWNGASTLYQSLAVAN